jgi:hypothetical protein
MFSEPSINAVSNLFNSPGIGLELMGASVLAFGVACYLARVAWIALSHARRMELESMQSLAFAGPNEEYQGPYCAG